MQRRKKKRTNIRKVTRSRGKTDTEKVIKTGCPYISPTLECLLDGFGSLNCLDSEFHESCVIKEKVSKTRGKRVFSS